MPLQETLPLETEETNLVEQEFQDLVTFSKIKSRLTQLIGSWSQEVEESSVRRALRYVDVDVKEMRDKNEIAPDETYVPDRIIDTNISREHPTFAKFLKGSRRLAIFRSLDDPDVDTQTLELDFTQGLTYTGWYLQFFREVDGAMTHGWDALEVMLDTSKPLNVGFEHIGHDNLYFNRAIEDFQASELVIRRYKVTALTLENYVRDYGFNQVQVDSLLNKNTAEKKKDEVFQIFKLYFKFQGIVFVAWFSQNRCEDWLKAPEMLDLGITEGGQLTQDPSSITQGDTTSVVPIDMYPIFIFPYKEDEDKEVTSKVGRCFLDEYRQEANTAVQTSFVNGLIRASHVYGSVDTDDGNGGAPKQLEIEIKPNTIFDKKINFWSFPSPEYEVLQALYFFSAQNANQAGQLDYAVMNRKDARKTAEEMKQASSESDDLKSVPLSFYSEHLRDIFTFVWKIVQSQALSGMVKICLVKQPVMMQGLMGPVETGQFQFVNDVALIAQNFDLRPAGDTDVIQREAKIRHMMEDWAVISTTPLAMRFLSDLMRLKYPDVGDDYAKILEAGDPVKALLLQLATVSTRCTSARRISSPISTRTTILADDARTDPTTHRSSCPIHSRQSTSKFKCKPNSKPIQP